MNDKHTLWLCISLLLLTFSCQRQKYSFSELPEDYIVFGNGGGFAGASNVYHLFPDGQVIGFVGPQQDTIFYRQTDKKTAQNIIETCMALPLNTMQINEPGNTYSFIRQMKADTSYTATWGSHEYDLPANIKTMYQQLRGLLVDKRIEADK